MDAIQSGDAVASYALFARASELFTPRRDLPSMIALFSLIEAAVLYDTVWYFPFGDDSELRVTETEIWDRLADAEICRVADLEIEEVLSSRARAEFEHSMRALGPVPIYNDVDEQECLRRAFDYGIKVSPSFIHNFARIFTDEELGTAEGVRQFVASVDGTSSRRGEERQLDWEQAASYIARACVSHGHGADYVGDPFEHPITALTIRSRRESPTAQLYSKLVTAFQGKLQGLKDDGYPMGLSVPPVPAIVLDRSDGSLRSVVQETVCLRDEFNTFRERYHGYAKTLRDPSARTLKELLDERWTAITEVTAAINALGGQRTDSTLIQGLIGGNIRVVDGDGFDGVSLDPAVSLGGLAKLGIQKVKGAIVKARASILFDVWSKALDIGKYNTLCERRLGAAFSDKAILAYQGYAGAVEKLIRPTRN